MKCRDCNIEFEPPLTDPYNVAICPHCREKMKELHRGYVAYMVKHFSKESLAWLDGEIDGFYLFEQDNPSFASYK